MDAAQASLKVTDLLSKLSGLRIVKNTDEKITVELTPTVNGVRDTYNRRYYIKFRRVSDNAYSIGQYRMPPGFFPDKDVSSYVEGSKDNLLTKEQVGEFTRRMRHICYCAAVRESEFQQIMMPSTVLPHLHEYVKVSSSNTVKFEIAHEDDDGLSVPVCYTLHYDWEEVRPNYVETSSERMDQDRLKILSDQFSSVMRDYPLLCAIEHMVTGSTNTIRESCSIPWMSIEKHISDTPRSTNSQRTSEVPLQQQMSDSVTSKNGQRRTPEVTLQKQISDTAMSTNGHRRTPKVPLEQQISDTASSTNNQRTPELPLQQQMSDSVTSKNGQRRTPEVPLQQQMSDSAMSTNGHRRTPNVPIEQQISETARSTNVHRGAPEVSVDQQVPYYDSSTHGPRSTSDISVDQIVSDSLSSANSTLEESELN